MLRMFAVIALAAAVAVAQAPAATLKVGSDAPPLSIAKWVKGNAVTLEKGKICVVEFWATWCGPCIMSMPHLSELQDQYKDKVTFIGVTAEDDNNKLDAVEKMVEQKGPGMGYTVGWDDAGKTYAAYMKAAGQGGIPCSFVVDGNGKIVYIGHPVLLDFVLARLVAGKWDAAKGMEEVKTALTRGNQILQMDRSMALSALPAFEKDYPELAWTEAIGTRETPSFPLAKMRLLLLAGKTAEASALGAQLTEKGVKYNNAMVLNGVSWLIVDPEMKIASRDLDLAMKAAEKAVEIEKDDGAIIDTLARVYYWKGDLTKAIELQTKAVACSQDRPDMADSLQGTLDEYKAEAAAKSGAGQKTE